MIEVVSLFWKVLIIVFFGYGFSALLASEILLIQAFEEIGSRNLTRERRISIFYRVYRHDLKCETLQNNLKFKIVCLLTKIFRMYMAIIFISFAVMASLKYLNFYFK
jgi:hypothetical protein